MATLYIYLQTLMSVENIYSDQGDIKQLDKVKMMWNLS